MKPKTFSETLRPKNGNDKEPLTVPRTGAIESLPGFTETEIENVEGLVITRPGEADNEVLNKVSTEAEMEFDELEEAGSEVADEGVFTRDAFFASYPELLNKSLQEVVIGADDRVRISPTNSFPWRSICALRITAQDNSKWIGTGWLVAPRTVITAGHCVYLHANGGWPKSIEVIPGMDDVNRPYGSFTGTTFRSVVGWVNDKKREYDYGAIILPKTSPARR